jgi:hypothetical protein
VTPEATELLALAPDQPRWVEARAMLLSGDPIGVRRDDAGAVIWSPPDRLAIALGAVQPATVVAAVAALDGDWSLLLAPERGDLEAALPRWSAVDVALYRLEDRSGLPDDEGAAPLGDEESLEHVAPPLRDELERARRRGVVMTVRVDGVAATFAHAPWRTETLFDIAVDTVPGFRQLGLATRVATALIRSEPERTAVWGAVAFNAASRALAARLGFVACDRLRVLGSP